MFLNKVQKEKLERTLHEPVLFEYETKVRPQIPWLFFIVWISILILPLPEVINTKYFEGTTGISDRFSYVFYVSTIILLALYFTKKSKLLNKINYIVVGTSTKLIIFVDNLLKTYYWKDFEDIKINSKNNILQVKLLYKDRKNHKKPYLLLPPSDNTERIYQIIKNDILKI